MPATAEQPSAVDEPKHPLVQLTTYELAAYRRQLQSAVRSSRRPRPRSRLACEISWPR